MKILLTKTILLVLFAFTISVSAANDSHTIQLTDSQEVISMASEDINQEESLHFVTYKDKKDKTYGIKSVFIDANNSAHELADITANDELSIVGYHRRNETITLLVTVEEKRTKTLIAYDLNALTKDIITSDLGEYNEPSAVFSYPFKTVFLTVEKDQLKAKQIAGSQVLKDQTFTITPEIEELVKDMSKGEINVINQAKYNENGPKNEFRAYAEGDELILEQLNQQSGNTNFLLLNLNDERVQQKQIKSEDKRLRDADSYIYNGNHFSLQQEDKYEYELNITAIRSGENLYKASLQNELQNYMNNTEWENFSSNARKGKNAPTITVNEGTNNSLITTIDYVDRNTYNYDYDLRRMFDHLRWMRQMDELHRMNNFGPSYLESAKYLYATREENHSIQIVFNQDLQPVEDASTETKLHNFDEDKYLKKIRRRQKYRTGFCGLYQGK